MVHFFLVMDELDGDEKRVSYDGMYAERDIVQVILVNYMSNLYE